jgi:hypothetical protein
MNRPTLSILTAIITFTSLKAISQNFQTDAQNQVNNQSVRQENQLTEEEYLEELQNNSEAMLEYQKQIDKMNIRAWKEQAEAARKIGGEEITGYEYQSDFDY